MIEVALDRLISAETSLVDALDGHDVSAIEGAVLAVAAAAGEVRGHASPTNALTLLDKIRHAVALADSARARVNYLTDHNRRRMELLLAAAGNERRTAAYGRDGRLRA